MRVRRARRRGSDPAFDRLSRLSLGCPRTVLEQTFMTHRQELGIPPRLLLHEVTVRPWTDSQRHLRSTESGPRRRHDHPSRSQSARPLAHKTFPWRVAGRLALRRDARNPHVRVGPEQRAPNTRPGSRRMCALGRPYSRARRASEEPRGFGRPFVSRLSRCRTVTGVEAVDGQERGLSAQDTDSRHYADPTPKCNRPREDDVRTSAVPPLTFMRGDLVH